MTDRPVCDVCRLPVGRTGFSDIRAHGDVYVDKTAMIAEIAREDMPLVFSRPRGFGQTLLLSTFESLFSKGLEDFHGLAIERLWKDRTYPVVRLDFRSLAGCDAEGLKRRLDEMLVRGFGLCGKVSMLDARNEYRFPGMLLDRIADGLDDSSTVLLIDGYDTPLAYQMDNPDELDAMRRLLNSFYAVIKSCTDAFRFIFIAGVTRSLCSGIFSGFNNYMDIGLDPEYSALSGFTKDELVRYFGDYVRNAAQALHMTEDEVHAELEQHYGGYRFAFPHLFGKQQVLEPLYNPLSVLNFLQRPEDGFQNHWYESAGSPAAVTGLLRHERPDYLDSPDVQEFLDGRDVREYRIPTYQDQLRLHYEITGIPPQVLLCQAGYATLHEEENGARFLAPANEEALDALRRLMERVRS